MASGQERFIAQLEQAAKRVDIMSPNEISSLFRRAALRLRNAGNLLAGLDAASGRAGGMAEGEKVADPSC